MGLLIHPTCICGVMLLLCRDPAVSFGLRTKRDRLSGDTWEQEPLGTWGRSSRPHITAWNIRDPRCLVMNVCVIRTKQLAKARRERFRLSASDGFQPILAGRKEGALLSKAVGP